MLLCFNLSYSNFSLHSFSELCSFFWTVDRVAAAVYAKVDELDRFSRTA